MRLETIPAIPVVTPIIHLNGDRREVLLERLKKAYLAVLDAQHILCECAPNGRNFYPEPGRYEQADTQHRQRQAHLQVVMDSLAAEAMELQHHPSAYKG